MNGRTKIASGLSLIEPEKIEYPEPEEILEPVAAKEERNLDIISEMRELLEGGMQGE